MIHSFEKEVAELSSFLKNQLEKRLDAPKNKDSRTLNTITNRYVSCLNLSQIPSINFYSQYLFAQQQNIEMVALSCEFFGGVFYHHLESRRCFKTLNDMEQGLSLAYSLMSKHNPELDSIDEQAKQVLGAFRQTTQHLKEQDSKILELYR